MKFIPVFLAFTPLLVGFYKPLNAQHQTQKPLRILSYNIQFLPGFAIHLKHFPHKRAPHIADAIISDSIDVVVFQEMFDKRGRKILVRKMMEHFPYMIGPGKQPKKWKKGSGVMIISKHPIRPLQKIRFTRCKGIDCLAKKGVVAAEVDYPTQKFQVFGTHLQAFTTGKIMHSQLRDFGNLLRKHQKNGVPQFSVGDFNIRSSDTILYPLMITELDSEDGELSGEVKYTSDFSTNDMNHYKDEHQDLIDYILYRKNGVQPKSITRQVRIYRHQWSKKNKDLSDHFAVMMEVQF